MNKQLTIRTTAIAASAALMAAVALSGSAFAHHEPGHDQGRGDTGPPDPKPVACDLSSETHKCVNTLQSVNAAILGATTVNDRDENSLLNKVCEANYKYLADKFDDAAQKLYDISMTINNKRKVSETDQASISKAATDAAELVMFDNCSDDAD